MTMNMIRPADAPLAMVVGADTPAGAAVAWALARDGWRLVLRGENSTLKARLARLGAAPHWLASDPVSADLPVRLLVMAGQGDVAALSAALLPSMLARGEGMLLRISFQDDADCALDTIEARHGHDGVRALVLHSDPLENSDGREPVMAAEIADAVLLAVGQSGLPGNHLRLSAGRLVRSAGASRTELFAAPAAAADIVVPPSAVEDVVRRVLSLAPSATLARGGLGVTPGWDSMRHIQLLLEVERMLGIRFTAAEMEASHRYDALEALARRKLEGVT